MEFENKVLSREIQDNLYSTGKTLATAESCTGGHVAQSIIAIPGASDYFKGGIICYTNEIKERILGVPASLIEEKTAVCEEVAREMVKGAVKVLNTDFAVAVTGIAGPGGGTKDIPVGTIWIACGSKDQIMTLQLTEDQGRDINIAVATSKALQLLIDFLMQYNPKPEEKEEDLF